MPSTRSVRAYSDIPAWARDAGNVFYSSRHVATGYVNGLTRWNAGAFTAMTALTSVDWYFVDWRSSAAGNTYFHDPGGWLNTGTLLDSDYWGGTFPAGMTFTLPAGVYQYKLYYYTEGNTPADSLSLAMIDWAEAPYSDALGGIAQFDTYSSGVFPNDMQVDPKEAVRENTLVLERTTNVVPMLNIKAGAPRAAGESIQTAFFVIVKVA